MSRIGTTIPHAEHGAPNCRGYLVATVEGDYAGIACNECGTVIRKIPAHQLAGILMQIELGDSVSAAICRNCAWPHIFAGMSSVKIFICEHCGGEVETSRLR